MSGMTATDREWQLLARLVEAVERIADCLDDLNHDGTLRLGGKVVTVEDRP